MGFMNGNVVGTKTAIKKANVIGNVISCIIVAAFMVVTVLAVTGVITF